MDNLLYDIFKGVGNYAFPQAKSDIHSKTTGQVQKRKGSRGLLGDFLAEKIYSDPPVSPTAGGEQVVGVPPGQTRLRDIFKGTSQAAPRQEVMGASSIEDYIPKTQQQTNQSLNNYQQNITIPGSQGGSTRIPNEIAQLLMESFDDIGEATNAARVLHHPREQTYMPYEIEKYGRESFNHGENASFQPVADSKQADGSIDRGLMRINSNTFNGLMKRHPDWMEAEGITDWDQMKNPEDNIKVARLILLDSNYDRGRVADEPSWKRWFAAPLDLRDR